MSEASLSFSALNLPGSLTSPLSLKVHAGTENGSSDFCPEEECEHVELLLRKEQNECVYHSSSETPALVEASAIFVH